VIEQALPDMIGVVFRLTEQVGDVMIVGHVVNEIAFAS
jgi:hypothetical protein